MIRRILLATLVAGAVVAAWHWSPLKRENHAGETAGDRESARECLQGDVVVTANLLNLRAFPVNGKVIGQFGADTRLNASRCAAGWAEIAASGWVDADYLRSVPDGGPGYAVNDGAIASDDLPPPRPSVENNCATGYRQVSASRLNLRKAPVDGALVGQLAVGAGVTVSRCDGDWAQITVAGWAHTNYLSAAGRP